MNERARKLCADDLIATFATAFASLLRRRELNRGDFLERLPFQVWCSQGPCAEGLKLIQSATSTGAR